MIRLVEIIHVTVKPGSKRGPYTQLGIDGSLMVCVKEPALEGRANQAVISELAKFYDIPKSKIVLKSGLKSKYKTFVISKVAG